MPGSLDATAQDIVAAGARACAVAMDLLDRTSVEEAAAVAAEAWGRLDILVNNAIHQGPGPMESFRQLSIDDAETVGQILRASELEKAA